MTRTAIIAGAGGLPAALAAAMGERPFVAALEGFAPAGLAVDLSFRVERLVPFLRALGDAGVERVCFAGAVQRPRLDPALFDPDTAVMVPRLLAAMGQGDDATLREVLAIFEEAGFALAGVEEVAPALVPSAGVLCGQVTERDRSDAARAAVIVSALGRVDVGQGAVVQQGLCLAVEALPGTDAMLAGVAAIPTGLRPAGARGVFYKAPKPLQDRRVDLPALGVETVRRVAAAGLGGIVFEAGGVICLDLPAMVAEAEALGLFLWAREP
ncbi:MAG: phosphatidate cytidylyltransferase [Rhodobacter sp. CACIA14H1]|nr:MAG: phosphatidate cytidylyltransferase [Rhodobacter sp. CACIA14H1]